MVWILCFSVSWNMRGKHLLIRYKERRGWKWNVTAKKGIFDLFSEREPFRSLHLKCCSDVPIRPNSHWKAPACISWCLLWVRYKFHPDKQERAERTNLNQPSLYSFSVIACMQISTNLFVTMKNVMNAWKDVVWVSVHNWTNWSPHQNGKKQVNQTQMSLRIFQCLGEQQGENELTMFSVRRLKCFLNH